MILRELKKRLRSLVRLSTKLGHRVFRKSFFLLFFWAMIGYAGAATQLDKGMVTVNLFMTSTCPHCHHANDFFRELSERHHWLKINRNVINEDKAQLANFYQQLKAFDTDDFSVPTIIFCDSRWVGFNTPKTTGKSLFRALSYCHEQLLKDGLVTDVTRKTLQQWSATSQLNLTLKMMQPPSLMGRLISTSLLEAFTPCSLCCFLLFLSFLWLYPDCRTSRLFLGLSALLMLAVLHTAQFVFTVQYQLWKLYLTPFSWLAAIALLVYVGYWIYAWYVKQVSRWRAWHFLIMLLSFPAIYANQQSCGLSVGALFQKWLSTQSLTLSALAFCQFTYLVFYLSPMILLLAFYLVFSVRPRQVLPVTACLMLGVMGILLIVYPAGLSMVWFSIILLFASLLFGWKLGSYSLRYKA